MITEVRAATCLLEVSVLMTEQGKTIKELRSRLIEKEKTERLHMERIVALQAELAQAKDLRTL